jgi:hypothetical protein
LEREHTEEHVVEVGTGTGLYVQRRQRLLAQHGAGLVVESCVDIENEDLATGAGLQELLGTGRVPVLGEGGLDSRGILDVLFEVRQLDVGFSIGRYCVSVSLHESMMVDESSESLHELLTEGEYEVSSCG